MNRSTHRNHLIHLPGVDGRVGERLNFSKHLIIDLSGCNARISNNLAVTQYAIECVELLDMKPFGPPVVQHFGHHSPDTSGYTAIQGSLMQLIETSNISGRFLDLAPEAELGLGEAIGHYVDAERTAHLDLHSCQEFDHIAAMEHAEKFFGARTSVVSLLYR